MDWLTENLVSVISLLFGTGGILYAIIMRILDRKKYKVEVAKMQASAKSDEIENIKKAVESVYQPLIDRQNKLIEQQSQKIDTLNDKVEKLTDENRSLRDELSDVNDKVEKLTDENRSLRDELGEVNRALAAKADVQPRAANGTFTKRK